MKTTNYYNTFIEVAEDCPVNEAEIPPLRGNSKTVARMQYEMMADHPYEFTSDDVIFRVHAERNNIPQSQNEREKFFSKGRACLRSSPLGKRYGWGIHHDKEGKIAIYPVDSDEYGEFANHPDLEQTKAMRSKRG